MIVNIKQQLACIIIIITTISWNTRWKIIYQMEERSSVAYSGPEMFHRQSLKNIYIAPHKICIINVA